MENKNLTIVLLIAVIITTIGMGLFVVNTMKSFGAASGPAHYQMESFLQGVSAGARDQFLVSNVGVVASSGDMNIGSGDMFVDVSADRVGIGSSTPTTDLSVGAAGATSTISTGFFCMLVEDEAGRDIWVTMAITGNVVFATSTSPCNT